MKSPSPASHTVATGIFVAVAFLSWPPSALPQGPLAPPGAPAPTMKTLDQLDAKLEKRTPISALPFLISASGSYYVTGNLTSIFNGHGITINADNVTVDLGGFELVSGGGATSGVRLINSHINATIRNGTVRGWLGSSVVNENPTTSTEMRVEHLRVFAGGSAGIVLGNSGTARDCEVRGCAGIGISGGASCKVIDCTVTGETGAASDGIQMGIDSVVTNCVATVNGGDGIQTSTGSVVTGCTASDNAAHGFNISAGGVVRDCSARSNSSNGFACGSDCTLTNCSAIQNIANGLSGGSGCGFFNCTAGVNGGAGFSVGDVGTLQNCAARANTGNGFTVATSVTLMNCAAESNTGVAGISTSIACTLIGCVVRASTNAAATSGGILAGTECLVSQCVASNIDSGNGVFSSTTGMGISVGGSSTVERCTVQGCRGDGIRATSSCFIIGNTCDRNGSSTGDGAGIHTISVENRIEGNSVTGNDRGIDVDSTGSLIIKNTAATNTIAYQIAASNRFGPIINITAAGVAAQTITDASANVGSVMGSTDPWANFLY